MTKLGKVQTKDVMERFDLSRDQFYGMVKKHPKIIEGLKQLMKIENLSARKS